MSNLKDFIPNITLGDLKKFITKIEHDIQGADIDTIPISFEMLVATFFPTAYYNMERALNNEHMMGYLEGLNSKNN